jgi:hypothetical protein
MRSLHDLRFFIECFYSRDLDLLRRLKDDLGSIRERMISMITIHELYHIS